jgi:hypothetical protein
VANHKGGQENSCRRMVDVTLEFVVESSSGKMLAMVVRADDTMEPKKIERKSKESNTSSTGGCAD